MENITLRPFVHKGKACIGLYFPAQSALQNTVRTIKEIKWSQTHKCWYSILSKNNYQHICETLKGSACIDNSMLKAWLEKKKKADHVPSKKPTGQPVTLTSNGKLCDKNSTALHLFLQHLTLKAYGESTIRTYKNEFLQLLQLLKQRPVETLTSDDIKRYMVYCLEKQAITENTAHSRLNALKFYFEQVLGREKFFWEIPRPKKQLQMPHFFNQDDITAILKATGNIKHKTMLMLAYASGLRVSEVVNIKTSDIDSKRMCILIRQAKGKKDRMVSLSPVLLVMLRDYWKTGNPTREGFLFPGQDKNEPYSSRSLQLVMAEAKKKAGVLKPGSIHALRHSFATHLLDKGTDVTMIMKLLGHNDIKTTLRYLHVTNRDMLQIISPLDDLVL